MGKKEDYFRGFGPKKHSPELIVRDYVLIYSLTAVRLKSGACGLTY